MKKILFGFLIFGFICSGFTNTTETTEPDPSEDDYTYQDDNSQDYQYGDDEVSEEKKREPEQPKEIEVIATLTKTEYTKKVKVGEEVELDCTKFLRTSTLDKHIVNWLNDTTRLTQDKFLITKSSRVKIIPKNKNLIIENIQPSDENRYTCEILPERLNLIVNLEVEAPPKIEIVNNGRQVMGNTISFREGSRIEVDCIASGKPQPTITWASEGKLLGDSKNIQVNNGKLVIEKAEYHHGSVYQCLAENSDKLKAHGAVTIDIHYAPHVTIPKEIVNGGEGYTRQLKCLFKSVPHGRVHWFKNHNMLEDKDKYNIIHDMHNHQNRSILIIKNIDRGDVGHYQCKVINSLGSASGNVSLVFTPEPAHFERKTIHGKEVVIDWIIHSVQPLTDIIMYYQKSGEKAWSKEKPIINGRNETHGTWHVQHKLLLSPGEWNTRVKSINSEGDSMSPSEIIVIPTINEYDDFVDSSEAGSDGGSGTVKLFITNLLPLLALVTISRTLFHH